MIAAARHDLMGFVDPSGLGVGFLVPLFRSIRSNSPAVQVLDARGLVAGFEPYEVPEPLILAGPALTRMAGEVPIAAFSFAPGDVVIEADQAGRDELAGRFHDPALVKRPTVAMELAAHLGREDLRIEKAREAHARLARVSRGIADDWRDLGILTTEMRKMLAATTRRPAAAADLIVRVREEVVEITGLAQDASAGWRASVVAACEQALDYLEALLPRPAKGWRFKSAVSRNDRGDDVDAEVLLASDRARRIFRADAPLTTPSLRLLDLDHGGSLDWREGSGVPIFVVQDSAASLEAVPSDAHLIGLGIPKHRPQAVAGHPMTLVSTTGMGSGKTADHHQLAGVRLAIAAELDRQRADISSLAERKLLLRARGGNPLAMDQAVASLFDKAWAAGLAPWRSLVIAPDPAGPDVERLAGVAEVLFSGCKFLTGDLCEAALARSKGTVAILVNDEPREAADEERCRAAIAFLLERQGWKVDRGPSVRRDTLMVQGRHWEFQVRMASDLPVQNTDGTYLPDVELSQLRNLVVTSSATAASILRQFWQEPALQANVQDLVALRADEATSLSVVAAQLGRMTTALTSRSRGQYVGMITLEALRSGVADGSDTRSLAALIRRPDFGTHVQLSLRSATMRRGALVAEVRVSALDNTQGERTGSYKLIVEPSKVHVAALALPVFT